MNIGNNSKGSTLDQQISDKNTDQEGVSPVADKSPKDAQNAKANTVSPKPGNCILLLFNFCVV